MFFLNGGNSRNMAEQEDPELISSHGHTKKTATFL